MSRCEVGDRIKVIRFYDHNDNNYESTFHVLLYGDRGIVFGMHGKGFYNAFVRHCAEIFDALQVSRLEGYTMPAHSRLMKRMLKDVADVREDGIGECAGREMVWMVVRKLEG